MKCSICRADQNAEPIEHVFRCSACGFFESDLPVRINQVATIDENKRHSALKLLRKANFETILDVCGPYLPTDGKILDVGCAHGWFLQAAGARGFDITGIEPDRDLIDVARQTGQPIIEGFFPHDLPPGKRWAAITFNDVFEHLPNIDVTAADIADRLQPGGILILNLPCSDGLIFRLARIAAFLGYKGPLRRMWQVGLPSPHLAYFDEATLVTLMRRYNLELILRHRLEAIVTDGLRERIQYDTSISAMEAEVTYRAALLLRIVLRFFPSDIQFFAFRKRSV